MDSELPPPDQEADAATPQAPRPSPPPMAPPAAAPIFAAPQAQLPNGQPALDDREGWQKLFLPAHTSKSFAEHFWALPTPESQGRLAELRQAGKAVCGYIGCTKEGVQLCQACKDRGRINFHVCSLDCLRLEWDRHKVLHSQPLLPPEPQDIQVSLAAETNRLLAAARRVEEDQRLMQRQMQASLTEEFVANEDQVQRKLAQTRVRFNCVQNPFHRSQFLRVLDQQWALQHGTAAEAEDELKAADVPATTSAAAVPPRAVPVSPAAAPEPGSPAGGVYPVWNNPENKGRDWLHLGFAKQAIDANLLTRLGVSHLINMSPGHPQVNTDEILKIVKTLRLHYNEIPSVRLDAQMASSSKPAAVPFLELPVLPSSDPMAAEAKQQEAGLPVLPSALVAFQRPPMAAAAAPSKPLKKTPKSPSGKPVVSIGELSDRVQQLWGILTQCQQTDGRALIFTAESDLGEPAGLAASFIMFQAKWTVPRIARHLLRDRGCLLAIPPEPYLLLLDRFQYSLLMQATVIRDAVASPDGQVLMDSGNGNWQPVLRGDGAPIGAQDPDQLARGVIKLSFWYDTKDNRMCLQILQAMGLDQAANNAPDPLVRTNWLPGHRLLPQQKTRSVKKSKDPFWNQTLSFEVPEKYARNAILHLELLDHAILGAIGFLPFKHRDLGCIQLALNMMPLDNSEARWYAVSPSPSPDELKLLISPPQQMGPSRDDDLGQRRRGSRGNRPTTPPAQLVDR